MSILYTVSRTLQGTSAAPSTVQNGGGGEQHPVYNRNPFFSDFGAPGGVGFNLGVAPSASM